ncbi:MAG: ABC transporter permease, partial [Burkholderiaceae bacterium]|nr:ABC transporter permease [Burkholderiaceae bacterium]
MNTLVSELPAANRELLEAEKLAQARMRKRKILVYSLRLFVLVAVLGGWEVAGRMQWIDPFFFSMPSQIADQIWQWSNEGTAQGPLWTQILVTLEETALGFLIGAVAGIVAGIALGRNKLLADIFSLYIKIANSVP